MLRSVGVARTIAGTTAANMLYLGVTKMKKGIRLLTTISLLFLFPVLMHPAPPISIRVGSFWTLKVDSTDMTGGAGTGFVSSFESATNEVRITISKAAASWAITVRRVDSNWDSGFHLYAKQTTGAPISGGDIYQEVNTSSDSFFTGDTNTAIDIQYMLTGITVQTPVDDYVTTIEYTVTDT